MSVRKTITFLVPYPKGVAPSQRFRFEQYLSNLEKLNYKLKFRSFLSLAGWKLLNQKRQFFLIVHLIFGYARRMVHLFQCFSSDFIFIHREAAPMGPPIFEWLIVYILKKKVIYDFDDAIWLNDPTESRFIAILKYKQKVRQICRMSYKVSVGNEFLYNYSAANNSSSVIIPTTIDTKNLHNPVLYRNNRTWQNDKIVIGWTGSHSTLHYLEPLLPIMRELEQKFNFEFLVIADKNPNFQVKSFRFKNWNKNTEVQDLLRIDIGLMPLSSDLWSEGKCGFKALQYLSLNKPVLASPVGVNNKIIKHRVNGYLCQNLNDWYHYLSTSLSEVEETKKMGGNGRAFIEKNYSVGANSGVFLSLFD